MSQRSVCLVQASAAVSSLQLATWQALHPLLSLLCCGESNAVEPGFMGSIIAKAAFQAQIVPSAALVPLMQTLRYCACSSPSQLGPSKRRLALNRWSCLLDLCRSMWKSHYGMCVAVHMSDDLMSSASQVQEFLSVTLQLQDIMCTVAWQ